MICEWNGAFESLEYRLDHEDPAHFGVHGSTADADNNALQEEEEDEDRIN